MRKRTFLFVFVLGIFLGISPAWSEISNPIDCQISHGLSGQYQLPSGFLQISFDPQDVLRVPLNGTLPPGEYDLYVRVGRDNDQSKPDRLVEIALGETVLPLVYSNSSDRWIGPLRYRVAQPVDTIDLHGNSTVLIDSFWVVPAGKKFEGDSAGAVPNGPTPKDWQTVWLDWPEISKRPMWVTPDMPVEFRVRGASAKGVKGEANIVCHILDYDHNQVGQCEFTFPLTGPDTAQKMETIPVPNRFGPYLLRCMVKLPDGQEAEFQRIVMRISPPLEFTSAKLGGHGNFPLLRLMGAQWNRKWDCGGYDLLWSTVQPKEEDPLHLDYTPAVAPLKELVVLDWYHGNPLHGENVTGDLKRRWLGTYVKNVVEHFRGKIPAYEIRNEHYKDPSNEEYVQQHYELVRDTAKLIHKTDPKAIVLSGGPPPEYPWGKKWWEIFARKGLLRPLDVVSVHLYFGAGGTRPVDQDLACDDFVKWLRKLLDANGAKGKPIWDTESGLCPMESFYLGRMKIYGSWSNSGLTPRQPIPYQTSAAMMGRYLLLHFWHNIPWFYYHTTWGYGNNWSLCDWDQTPLPAAGTMAQLTRLMDQAKPASPPVLPKGLWGYRFRKGREIVTAFWAVELQPGEKRFVPFPKDVQVLDLFCNPIEPAEQLEVGVSPILLIGSAKAVTAATRKFVVTSKIELSSDKQKQSNCLTSLDSSAKADVKADSTAKDSSLERVRDEKQEEAWTSNGEGSEHWIEYEWPKEQTMNRVVIVWPAENLPEGFVLQWHDGLKWQPVGGPREAKQAVEDEMIPPVTTKRLRLLIRSAQGKPVRVTEFAAYFVPRLTPPLAEMQEIWSRGFKPNAEGFIRDWLICGPFPSPGDRFANEKRQITGWDTDFLSNDGKPGETAIQPRPEEEHVAKFPAGTRAPWKPMDVRVAWQPVHTGESNYLDLAKAFTNDVLFDSKVLTEQCIGYAACYIDLPEEVDGTLAVGSDDGYRIWIDDTVVAEHIAFRGAATDQEKYPVRLTKGKHRILVKIHNDLGGHGVYLRLLDRDGKPITGYTIKLIP